MRSVFSRPEPPRPGQKPGRVPVVCWLSFFEGLGCWYFWEENLLSTGLKLEEFDENKPVGDRPVRELVGCLMWLANQTHWILRTQ